MTNGWNVHMLLETKIKFIITIQYWKHPSFDFSSTFFPSLYSSFQPLLDLIKFVFVSDDPISLRRVRSRAEAPLMLKRTQHHTRV